MVIAFYSLAGIMVASLAFILFTKKMMHAIFTSVLTFLALAGMYVLLEATFIASAQIMIYVGGILILLVFGVMMTQRRQSDQPMVQIRVPWLSIVLTLFIFATLLYALFEDNKGCEWSFLPIPESKASVTHTLGVGLMSDYLLAFEMMAVLLMIGLMGASIITNHSPDNQTNDKITP